MYLQKGWGPTKYWRMAAVTRVPYPILGAGEAWVIPLLASGASIRHQVCGLPVWIEPCSVIKLLHRDVEHVTHEKRMTNFTYFKRMNILQCYYFSNFLCLILHSLTLLVLRSFKEEIPILVLTQVGDSDEDEPCSPPPIGLSPVWFLYAYFYCCLLSCMTICTEPTLASISYLISGETDHHTVSPYIIRQVIRLWHHWSYTLPSVLPQS